MHTARPAGPEIEVTAVRDHEFMPLCVAVTQEILADAGVTVMQHDVTVSNGPEVGTGAVVTDDAVSIDFQERVHVLPGGQIP